MRSYIKAIIILCAAVLACVSFFSCAKTEKDENGFVFELDKASNTYVLTSYVGNATDITIPDKYEGVTVSAVATDAFRDNDKIKTVKIHSLIKSIGQSAFYNCSSLTSVEFVEGSSLTEIKTACFSGCTMLNNIVLPDSVTTIGYKAFSGCTAMSSLTLPRALSEIGYYAFSECLSLKTVGINSSFTVCANAFSGCEELTMLATPEDDVGEAKYRYDHTKGLLMDESETTIVKFLRPDEESYEIPANISSIKDGAFFEQFLLRKITVHKDNPYFKPIGDALYTADGKILVAYPAGKNDVTEYVVPEGTEKIANYAFCGTQNLDSIVIADTVKVIGNCAFKGCSKLANVKMPSADEPITVGADAFESCKSLKTYLINDPSLPMKVVGGILFSSDGKKMISYSASLTDSVYKLPSDVTEIGDGAFSLNTFLSCIELDGENSLFASEDGVLYSADMTALVVYPAGKAESEFVCPDTVKTVYPYAFYGNIALKKVTLSASVELIPKYAFEGCVSLEALGFRALELDIHFNALKNCAALVNIDFAGNEAAWANAVKNASAGNDPIFTAEVRCNCKFNG